MCQASPLPGSNPVASPYTPPAQQTTPFGTVIPYGANAGLAATQAAEGPQAGSQTFQQQGFAGVATNPYPATATPTPTPTPTGTPTPTPTGDYRAYPGAPIKAGNPYQHDPGATTPESGWSPATPYDPGATTSPVNPVNPNPVDTRPVSSPNPNFPGATTSPVNPIAPPKLMDTGPYTGATTNPVTPMQDFAGALNSLAGGYTQPAGGVMAQPTNARGTVSNALMRRYRPTGYF